MNLPNLLTLSRLLLLPLIVFLLWPPYVDGQRAFCAAIAFIVAGIFDVVDGALARRTGQVTTIGKFLDPLADKLLYLVTYSALVALPGTWAPAWILMVTVSRELIITGLRAIASAQGIVIAAGQGGKIKTSFGTAGLASLIIHYPFYVPLGIGTYCVDAQLVGYVLTLFSLFFSITSAAEYIAAFARATRVST